METRQKKIINHKIFNEHWFIGSILLIIWGYLFTYFISVIVAVILGNVIPLPKEEIMYIGMILGALLTLLVHKRWFYPEYEGSLKTKDLKRWLITGLIILVIVLLPDIITSLILKTNLGAPTLHSVLMAGVAGTVEETVFRGLPVSYLMRQNKKKSHIIWIAIVTSLIFGSVHGFNFFAGATLLAALLQVISASAAGFLLCALFIRSGSLLPSMLMHAINDVYAFMNLDLVSEAGVMEGTLKTSDIVLNMILSVLQIIIAIYLLQPSAWDEIMETWNRKWGKEN